MLGKEGREEGRERGEGGDSENGGSAGDRVVAGRGEGRSGGGGRGGRTLFAREEREWERRRLFGRVVVVVMVYVGGKGRGGGGRWESKTFSVYLGCPAGQTESRFEGVIVPFDLPKGRSHNFLGQNKLKSLQLTIHDTNILLQTIICKQIELVQNPMTLCIQN